MATLNIGGKRVKVSDAFLSMTPEQQSATVEEIAGSLGSPEPQESDAARSFREQASAMTQNPTVERTGFQRVDDAVRGAADMMTFGLSDEMSAGLGALTGIGGDLWDYSKNLEAQRSRDAKGGVERFGGQVAGAFALPGKLALSLPGAIGKGAAGGAAYGFNSGEDGFVNRLGSAGLGATVGGAAGGAVRGIANKFQNRAAARTIPTNEQLKAAGNAAYKAADDAGVIFRPEGVQRMANDIRVDLAEFGFHPQLQPRVAVVLDELERLQKGNVTLKGMDTLRRIADSARKSQDASEKALGNRIIEHIDEFMMNPAADDVLMGNAAAAGQAMRAGRDVWGRMRKSEKVDVAALKAERRAASTGSGGNLDNTLRQNVRGLLDNPKTMRGMTDTEKAAAERVVRGTPTQNMLRLGGKLSPQGNGLMAALGIGGTMVNPMIGAASLGGMAAKTVADRMTVRNAERLSQIIRSGGRSARDLAELARKGKLDIQQVRRIERLARTFNMSVPQLAAAAAEQLTATRR